MASFLDFFTKKKISALSLEEMEEVLLTANFGVKTTQKLLSLLAAKRVEKEQDIKELFINEVTKILTPCEKKFEIAPTPFVVLMIGVNGAGKTTVIGKLAHLYKNKKTSLIAADTFRAGAVEQLEVWGQRNNITVYKGAPECDSAGLCFDKLNEAIKNGDELIFIDTAGRLQNKANLMAELQKIVRVIKKIIPQAPHQTLLVLDASNGQNAVEQVAIFNEQIGIDGLIINKVDGSSKAGTLISIADNYKLPVYFIGTGEKIDDIAEFNAQKFAQRLFE